MFLPISQIPLLITSISIECIQTFLFIRLSFKSIECTERTSLTNFKSSDMSSLKFYHIFLKTKTENCRVYTCVSTSWIQHLLTFFHICFISIYAYRTVIHIYILTIWILQTYSSPFNTSSMS